MSTAWSSGSSNPVRDIQKAMADLVKEYKVPENSFKTLYEQAASQVNPMSDDGLMWYPAPGLRPWATTAEANFPVKYMVFKDKPHPLLRGEVIPDETYPFYDHTDLYGIDPKQWREWALQKTLQGRITSLEYRLLNRYYALNDEPFLCDIEVAVATALTDIKALLTAYDERNRAELEKQGRLTDLVAEASSGWLLGDAAAVARQQRWLTASAPEMVRAARNADRVRTAFVNASAIGVKIPVGILTDANGVPIRAGNMVTNPYMVMESMGFGVSRPNPGQPAVTGQSIKIVPTSV